MCLLTVAVLAAVAYSGSFEDVSNWETKNRGDAVRIDIGGVHEGAPCLYLGGPTSVCNTAWHVDMKGRVPVPADAKGWKLELEAAATHLLPRGYVTGVDYCSEIVWYGKDGRRLAADPLPFGVVPGGFQTIRSRGEVPGGAAFASLRFGQDHWKLKPGQWIAYRKLSLSFVGKDSSEWVPPMGFLEIDDRDMERLAVRPRVPSRAALAAKPYDGGASGPKATLRDDGVTLVDGKPFFPIGIYSVKKGDANGNSYDTAFKTLAAAGFNLVHSYVGPRDQEILDAAARQGMKMFVQARQPDEWIMKTGRRHPSILAWYLGDDTCVSETANGLRENHDAIKAVDPYRLTCQADGVGMEFVSPSYADFVNGTDVFLPEIYPVMCKEGDKTDFTCIAKTVYDMKLRQRIVNRLGQGVHACWPILQCFTVGNMWGHLPTRRQLFAMSFAALVNGGRGITWYSYEDAVRTERWTDLCELAGWLKELTPALVARDSVEQPTIEVLGGPVRDAYGQVPITAVLRDVGSERYLLTVNASHEPVRARVRTATAAKDIEDEWDGFAVHVYRILPDRTTIVSTSASDAVQRTAANELGKYLGERIGGQSLTVEGKGAAVFHIGNTEFARAKGLSAESFQDEEWAAKSFGRDVVLAGGGRGVLYAVYHFLEDDCGIGFFGNDDTEIPSGPLELDKIDRRGRPHFRYRCIHRGMVKNMHPEFVARRRLNSNSELGAIPAAFGGDVTYGPPNHVHTYDAYLPEAKYFKEHPEYYALKEGVRWPGKTGQLCLANPDVRRILKEGLLANIARGEAKAREAGQPPPRFYELSMNDNWRRCECEACKAECKKYNPSGQQIRLMNELAAAIRGKYPRVVLTTLAYFYSEPPPKGGVKAADNVLVKLCDTRTNSASGIHEDENGFFRELVEGWRKCVGEFIVWDYAIVYDDRTQSFPFPSENTFGDFFRYMADQRAYGFFIEQEKSDVSDQYELKFYLQSQLMENPYANVKDLYWTFMSRYYGKAAASVHEARKRLAQSAQERHAYIDWLANVGAFDFLTEEDTAFMRACYDRAEKAVAGEPQRLARVRKSRRGVDELSRIQAEAPKPNKDGVFVLEGDLISLPSQNAVARVDDPDSPSGKAVRCLTDENKGRYFDPPVVWGMYDVSKKTTLESGRIEIPSERGYRWHDLGEHTFPGSGYMYFTRGWPVQICPSFPGIAGKRFNVRALIRFVGPVYHPGEAGKSWIDFARFELSPVTPGPK